MMNYNWRPSCPEYPLKDDFTRKYAERMALIPVRITEDGFVQPVEYHGSAHITALSGADGIITVPLGVTNLVKGTLLTFRQI